MRNDGILVICCCEIKYGIRDKKGCQGRLHNFQLEQLSGGAFAEMRRVWIVEGPIGGSTRSSVLNTLNLRFLFRHLSRKVM